MLAGRRTYTPQHTPKRRSQSPLDCAPPSSSRAPPDRSEDGGSLGDVVQLYWRFQAARKEEDKEGFTIVEDTRKERSEWVKRVPRMEELKGAREEQRREVERRENHDDIIDYVRPPPLASPKTALTLISFNSFTRKAS